ncbi:MAG: hypothetical protein LKE51_02770 [Selenomonas sp.]|jgi:hypothetical protein|nr:hypothetical protein [Selenomonas sp.]
MKELIMCEGPNEKAVMDILIDNGLLVFDRDDLLGLAVYHARQIKTSGQVRNALDMYSGQVEILRVGDKLSDEIKKIKAYERQLMSIRKYCTKPELEILLIIGEKLLSSFEKVKSKVKPKDFSKQKIQYNGVKYRNQTDFYKMYFGLRPKLLVQCLKAYKSSHRNKSGELYIADLLK